jgi:hypothetical protein
MATCLSLRFFLILLSFLFSGKIREATVPYMDSCHRVFPCHLERHPHDPGGRIEDGGFAQGGSVAVHGPDEANGHERVHSSDDGL